MFTGIVTDVGTVRTAEQRGDLRLTIGTSYGATAKWWSDPRALTTYLSDW